MCCLRNPKKISVSVGKSMKNVDYSAVSATQEYLMVRNTIKTVRNVASPILHFGEGLTFIEINQLLISGPFCT